MSEFYRLPIWAQLLHLAVLTAAVLVQTLGLTCGFQRLHRRGSIWLDNLLELTVLVQLLLLVRLRADTLYHLYSVLVYPAGHGVLRWTVFLLLTLLTAAVCWQRQLFLPLLTPLASALTLPPVEQMIGRGYPAVMAAAELFLLARCVHMLLLRSGEQRSRLSELSIKEAVDTMDFGLLFCQKDGQILLQNSRMQELLYTLAGTFQCNGKAFYEDLLAGNVSPGCRRGEMGSQLAYWLPDGTVWVFELYMLPVPRGAREQCVLLVAANTTERWKATHQLWEQNRELEQRNQELRGVLQNLQSICKTEEIIHAKTRVHDVLGQRVSLLLRAMREHREPDEVLLDSFAEGLPRELTRATSGSCSLDTLTDVFRGLGVTIRVEGKLPGEDALARPLFEIAAEAVTNAVRHGYASEVKIGIGEQPDGWQMQITDSGIPAAGPVTEGGGLKGMRRRVARLGGRFSYTTSPHFTIDVFVPKGEAV